MDQIKFINCDQCGNEIQLENVFAKELQKEFDEKINAERVKMSNLYKEKENQLAEEKKKLESFKEKEREIFMERIKKEKASLSEQLRKEIKEDFSMQIESQRKDIERKRTELNKLKEKELEMERLKQEMQNQEKEIELKYLKKLNEQSHIMEDQISKRLGEQSALSLMEKDKQLEDFKKQIVEMKRKADQGSMQLQGEIQELAIEKYLKENFPLDHIVEIKKGARGGDCIQEINTRGHLNVGTIYYESKRTKEFSGSWIEKFKKDLQDKNADIGVIVTEAMPKNMDRMGLKDGVWICTFEEFKALCFILRESLIQVFRVKATEDNKGDKMHMLYDYLTGNEFKMQIEGIVDGFQQMQVDLGKEKASMHRIWAQREKQILKVLNNTSFLYGSIKGIAGSAIQQIDQLELPDGDNEILDEL